MIQRILTALVLIPLVLLLILRAPLPVLAIVSGIVALLAIREFLELARHYGVEPFSIATYFLVGFLFVPILAINTSQGDLLDFRVPQFFSAIGLMIALGPFIFLSMGLKRRSLASIYPAASASVFAIGYIAIPMALLIDIRLSSAGAFMLIFLMAVVWSGDIFAYFVGKSLGRHKMSPRISPKKTWEGAAASVIASIFFGTLLYRYSLPIGSWLLSVHLLKSPELDWYPVQVPLWRVVLLAAVLNIAAQLGDLVESMIKRGADVKDSGAILPGHGGMLDRIDAMLFATPVLWLYSVWLGVSSQ